MELDVADPESKRIIASSSPPSPRRSGKPESLHGKGTNQAVDAWQPHDDLNRNISGPTVEERKAAEAALFRMTCPWEETSEKRYPPPNPDFFTDFEKKYPPDQFGESANPNACVWRVYRHRVTGLDEDLLDGWHKTLDVLLIFIGLFSAVATAFIIESYKRLQPDFGEITARGVVALLAQTNASFAVPISIPSFDSVETSARTMWINGLWFSSLTLALVDALLTILTKQWLVEYASKQRQPAASAQTWAWRHYAFRQGLDKWGIGVFVSSLSVILYSALYLFLFGLLVLLFELDIRMCIASITLTVLAGAFHLVSVFLPLWFGDCPTTTPMLTHMRWLVSWGLGRLSLIRLWSVRIERQMQIRLYNLLGHTPDRSASASEQDPGAQPEIKTLPPAAYDGSRIIEGQKPLRDATILSWMINNLLTDADVGVALEAIGCLNLQDHDEYAWPERSPLLSSSISRRAEERLMLMARTSDRGNGLMRAASAIRTVLFLRHHVPMGIDLLPHIQQYMQTPIYDLAILAHMLYEVHYSNFKKIQAVHQNSLSRLSFWHSNDPSATIPIQAPTQDLLFAHVNSGLDAHIYASSDPSNPSVIHGLCGLAAYSPPRLKFVARVAFVFANHLVEPGTQHRLALFNAEGISPVLSAAIAWAFLLGELKNVSTRSQYQDIYCMLLQQIPDDSPKSPRHFVAALSCFSPAENMTQYWQARHLTAAANTLLRLLKPGFVWSDELNEILRGLLYNCDTNTLIDPELSSKVTIILSELASTERISGNNHKRIITRLTHQPLEVARSYLNMLSRNHAGFLGHISTWEFAMRPNRGDRAWYGSVALLLATELALLAHSPLANDLLRDLELEALLDALVGGDRGVKLALTAMPADFVSLAVHARAVSETWWTTTKTNLLQIPRRPWDQGVASSQYDSPADLIDDIESHGACMECAASIVEWEQILAQRAAEAAEQSTVPNTGATQDNGIVQSAETSSGLRFGADHSQPSRNRATGWSHLRILLQFSRRAHLHDAEMQERTHS